VADPAKKPVVVIGGGIGGITVAVEAAETGADVVLIEKEPWLGGRVFMMHRYFPKLCPPLCGMEINFRRIRSNPKIRVITNATVAAVSGRAGDFKIALTIAPERVNANCTACNRCVEVCPVERADDFNLGMSKTKAVYLRHPMAYPARYAIDAAVCLGTECSKCVDACQYGAISLSAVETALEVDGASVVYATGWKPYDAAKIDTLGFGRVKNVINNLMMERMASPSGPAAGKILRPSDGKEVKTLAFVQCAGSRDQNHLPYCSSVCCLASLKQATYLRAQYPDSKVIIFYIDIRTPGKYEAFYAKVARDGNISFIKGKVAKVEEDAATGDVLLTAEDIFGGGKKEYRVDMAVLATGMEPNGNGENGLAVRDANGFIAAQRLAPGVFAAGVAKNPADVTTSLMDAAATALKTLGVRGGQ